MNRGRKLKNAATHVTLIVLIVFVNLPIINMVGTAFKPRVMAMTDPSLIPRVFSIENFVVVLRNAVFMQNLVNSLVIGLAVTGACIIVAASSGYAVSRFKSRMLRGFALLLLMLQMLPGILLLIPLYAIFNDLGLINTRLSVVIAYTAIFLPFSVWMLKGFFDTIPFEIEESAMIDGASYWTSFRRIILPISLPGIGAVGIFAFVNAWNEYMLASVFLRDDYRQTLTVGLQRFVQQFSAEWAALMAASSVAMIPSIIFLLFAQSYLVKGLTAGAVKG